MKHDLTRCLAQQSLQCYKKQAILEKNWVLVQQIL